MSENSNNNQPEKQEKEIIRCFLNKEGKIQIVIYGNHIPSLAYIHKLLSVEIDKRIINEQVRSVTNHSGVIIPKSNRPHNIINFLRGKYAS